MLTALEVTETGCREPACFTIRSAAQVDIMLRIARVYCIKSVDACTFSQVLPDRTN